MRSIFKLAIALLASLISHANGQVILTPHKSLGPLERVEENLKLMRLPPDPAFKAPMESAKLKRDECLEARLKIRYKSGQRSAEEMAADACRTCDKQVVLWDNLWFQANRHRYFELDLETGINSGRKKCLFDSAFTSTQIPSKLDADSREDKQPPLKIAQHGAWAINAETTYSGILLYKAWLLDRKVPERKIYLACSPAHKKLAVQLVIPIDPPQKVLLTFTVDGAPPDQIFAFSNGTEIDISELYFRFLKNESNPKVAYISVKDSKMAFDLAGASSVTAELVGRCHL